VVTIDQMVPLGFRLLCIGFVLLLFLKPALVATTTASDNAADPAYNSASDVPGGNAWANGDNGGTGFGAWSITTTANSGVFIGDSTNNGSAGFAYYYDVPMPLTTSADATAGINATHTNGNDNRSFGLWANSGGASDATRPLASPLQINQTVRADIDTGFIQTGGVDGLILQDSSGAARLQVSFTGGGFNYSVIGATAQQTVHGYTGDGLKLQFQLTDIDHYRLAIWFQNDASIEVFTGQLGGTPGNAISALHFFNHNAGSGSTNDFYFNNLAVLDDTGWQPQIFTGRVYDVDISDLTYSPYGALRVWIPDSVPTIRGIILYINYGYQGNTPDLADVRDFTTNNEWQAFCRTVGFALVATRQINPDSVGRDDNAMNVGLTRLAAASGHSELSYAPIAPLGMSNGGASAYNYNAFYPLRTISFATNKAGTNEVQTLSSAALNTPGMLIESENNCNCDDGQLTNFQTNRSAGGLLGFLDEPHFTHQNGYSANFIMKFYYNMVEQRVPTNLFAFATTLPLTPLFEANGWLGDNSTWKNSVMTIADYGSYSGDRRAASWMPDEDSAFLWRAVGSHNQPIKLNTENNRRLYRLGEPITVQCDTSALPAGWTTLQFFDGATKLGEITNNGSSWLEFSFTPALSETGGVSALATLSTGDQNTSNAARFVVRGDPPPPPTYSEWIASYGYTGANASPTADPDGDGIPNLLEYALGADPSTSSSTALPAVSLDSNSLSLTYTKYVGATGVVYTVEESTDLVNWITGSPTNTIVFDNGVTQSIKAQVPRTDAGLAGKLFLRLRVTQQ
jgi:hypothetical protein